MKSRPEAKGRTKVGEKNMVVANNDDAKQAVLGSMEKIGNVGRATREVSHPSHSLYESFKSDPVFFLSITPPSWRSV